MKLRTGWTVLVVAVAMSVAGRFLPGWWGASFMAAGSVTALGVVAVDVVMMRRSKGKRPRRGPTAEYCNGGTCYYLEPHRHGFACDKTCTTCGGH